MALGSWQGGSVSDIAEDGEEALGIPGEISSGGGEIVVIVPSTQLDGGVPRGGEVLRAVAGANAAVVFAEGLVADVVQPVLDAPVAAVVGQELLRIGLCA